MAVKTKQINQRQQEKHLFIFYNSITKHIYWAQRWSCTTRPTEPKSAAAPQDLLSLEAELHLGYHWAQRWSCTTRPMEELIGL